LRVLYVNHTSRVSGGEISLLTLLSSLPAGLEATVACPPGELAERVVQLGIDVHPIRGTDGSLRLHPLRTPQALVEMGQTAIQVRRAAVATGADLVHANSIRAGIVATTAASRRTPTVVHVRDCLPPGPLSSLTLRAIGRADALIANSAHTQATLGSARRRSHVVFNAVDLSRFEAPEPTREQARHRLGIDSDGPVLAVVAQITPWKGQDDAIEIARALAPSHPDLKLLLVGSPKFDSTATRYDNRAFLSSLQQQAREHGLEDVACFLGEREDIPEVLRAVDLLLVPSWEEPFGRSVVEAMAAGVPVVATDVGGPPEILSDSGERLGLTLPPRQPRAWATAIEGLLADPQSLARTSRLAKESAWRRFGVERHTTAILEIYEGIKPGVTSVA
jgi:glycosyltransferase involved in cell wall biosynthesis